MNAGRVIVVSYVLSRTHRIHQIAITEIARIICSVEPEMLHHFYDEHRTELRYVWPGQASLGCCWLYYASKILMGGGTETSGTIFCLTMRIISYCQWQIQCQNTVTNSLASSSLCPLEARIRAKSASLPCLAPGHNPGDE